MDDYSLAVAKELFAAFPQWQALARTEPTDDGGSFLALEVAPPKQANVEYPLMIQTEDREITVSFDSFHAHFDQWAGLWHACRNPGRVTLCEANCRGADRRHFMVAG